MRDRIVPRAAILLLVVAALILPVGVSVLVGLARLLATMGDASGGVALNWIAFACGILWVLDLVCLVLVQAINSLGGPDGPDEPA